MHLKVQLVVWGFILSIVGCGGNYQTKKVTKVGDTTYLDPAKASVRHQGFTEFNLDENGILSLTIEQRLYTPEFTAPLLQTADVSGKRANPIGAAVGAGITLGLYPLLAPKAFWSTTVGTEDKIQVLNTEPDRSKERPTGQYEWVALPFQNAELAINVGTGNDWFDIQQIYDNGKVMLNIGPILFDRTDGNSAIPIKIRCGNCDAGTERNLKTSTVILFEPPPSWELKKRYSNSNLIGWIDDSGLVGEKERLKPTSKNLANSWNEVLSLVNMKSMEIVEQKHELPTELKVARETLLRQRPKESVQLTRDEFESTAEFTERVLRTQEAQRLKVEEFNSKVVALNAAIIQFRTNAPKALAPEELTSVVTSTLYASLGVPKIEDVTYDADLKKFIVSVAGESRGTRSPMTFTLITRGEIESNTARSIKSSIENGRVFLEFSTDGTSISQVGGHIGTQETSIPVDFIADITQRQFETVHIDVGLKNDVDMLAQINSNLDLSIETQILNDSQSEELRKKINALRSKLQLAQRKKSEKEHLEQQLSNLENQLKNLDEGFFEDDLISKIKSLPQNDEDPHLFAIIVGIAEYSDLPNVVFADRSASSMTRVLQKRLGIPKENTIELINDEATGTRLLSRIEQVTKRLTTRDQLIFYYAGHGAPTKDGEQTMIVPHDGTLSSTQNESFSLDSLYESITESRAKHSWVILDSCFSGRADDDNLVFGDVAPLVVVPENAVVPQVPRLSVLAAGGPEDFANAYREKGYRLFTYHLINALIEDASISEDNFQRLSETVNGQSLDIGISLSQAPVFVGQRSPLGKKR